MNSIKLFLQKLFIILTYFIFDVLFGLFIFRFITNNSFFFSIYFVMITYHIIDNIFQFYIRKDYKDFRSYFSKYFIFHYFLYLICLSIISAVSGFFILIVNNFLLNLYYF